MYLKNDIQSKLLTDFTFIGELFEVRTVELLFGKDKVILTSVYHPPTSSIANNYAFIESLTNHLRLLFSMEIPLITMGDININALN